MKTATKPGGPNLELRRPRISSSTVMQASNANEAPVRGPAAVSVQSVSRDQLQALTWKAPVSVKTTSAFPLVGKLVVFSAKLWRCVVVPPVL